MEQRIGDQAQIRRAVSLDDFKDCDVLAVSSTSQDYGVAQQIAIEAKKDNPNIVTVLGGHHVSYLPQSMSEQFDIGVLGEGEETFSVLVRALVHGSDIGQIPGLAFHHEGRVVVTPPRGFINPIDIIPMPYRDYYGSVYLMSSRGCPYSCSFCTSKVFWGKTRFFSAPYVVAEIEHLASRMGDNPFINIYDDLFVADRKRLEEIICLLEKKGLTDTVAFGFSVRSNMVNDDLCEKIKRFRSVAVCFGAESGSDRVLKLMNKGATVAMNQNALDVLHKHGVSNACSFIVGWPTETEEEVRSTYEFIRRNAVEGKHPPKAAVNILMPMPGTPVWQQALDMGIIPKQGFDWNRLGIFASYHHSTAASFDDWVCARRENNSVYMNEDTLPQERLYQIMAEYDSARE
jgi:radical SAM superfamily enzyme YgiQ (UPF0313 family)